MTRSDCGRAVRAPLNPYPVPPASLAFWTRALPTPPVAPWRGHTWPQLRSPLSSTLLRSLAITLLRWKSLVSFLAQTQRPADVLTSALGNVCTALDISICSPHAQQAGPDCTRSWLVAKLDYHGLHLPSLLRQTISYTPIVWSACGDTLSPGQFCGMRGELCEALLSRRDTASPDRPTMLSTLCAALSFFSGPCEPLVQAGPLCSATSLTVAHDHVCCLDLLHVVQFFC